jgi:hypothetical protein
MPGAPGPGQPGVPGKPGQHGEPAPAPPASSPDEPSAPGGQKTEERDERPYAERVDEDERYRYWRRQNLRDLDEEETAVRAGRDAIGRDSIWASEGSTVYHADRDIIIGAASSREAQVVYLRQVGAEKLRRCLVASPSQKKLNEALDREPLVYLRGAEGTGRQTAALDALLTWTEDRVRVAGHEKFMHVGRIIPVGLRVHHALPELRRHGYVLDATTMDSIRKLDDLAEVLQDVTARSDCRVVVLVTADRSHLPAPRVVEHLPPSAHEVFRRYLDNEAADAGLEVHLPDELRLEIGDYLDRQGSPNDAIHMAMQLVSGLKDGKTFADLHADLTPKFQESIRRRLDESRPVLGRCFMISVAALNGLQEATVSTAALALAEHIKKLSSIKLEEPLPAWEQLHTWLEYADATASPPQMTGGGRTVHVKSRAAFYTLQILWEDHPTIREPLIAWLRDLAGEARRRPETEFAAARTAGILATFDFGVANTRFLTPWVNSRRWRDQRLAALMLESAVREPAILRRVLDLLQDWADGTRGKRLAAAHAYGSRIGLMEPGIALRDLRKISLRGMVDIDISRSVAGSIRDLYSADLAEAIIGELEKWVDSGSPGGRYTSALAFTRLAWIGRGDPCSPPLFELDPSRVPYERISKMWRNALSLRIVTSRPRRSDLAAPDSWNVLCGWVARYEEVFAIRAVIDEIIRAEGAEVVRLRKAFALNLRRWEYQRRISLDLCRHLIELTKGGR